MTAWCNQELETRRHLRLPAYQLIAAVRKWQEAGGIGAVPCVPKAMVLCNASLSAVMARPVGLEGWLDPDEITLAVQNTDEWLRCFYF